MSARVLAVQAHLAAREAAATRCACPAGDPLCPCQDDDGAACHHARFGPDPWRRAAEEADT